MAIKDTESHGQHIKILIEELLNCRNNESIVGITIELLNSMQVGNETKFSIFRMNIVLKKVFIISFIQHSRVNYIGLPH